MAGHDGFAEMLRWDPHGFEADGDGLWWRELTPRCFIGVRFTDMWENISERERGEMQRYEATVAMVDLDAIGSDELASAVRSCGWENMPDEPRALAECLIRYGDYAPLGSYYGNDLRQARREANELLADTDARSVALDKPVNAIGSTAAEFMRGDTWAALHRGVESGNKDAMLITKMYHAAGGNTLGAGNVSHLLPELPEGGA